MLSFMTKQSILESKNKENKKNVIQKQSVRGILLKSIYSKVLQPAILSKQNFIAGVFL